MNWLYPKLSRNRSESLLDYLLRSREIEDVDRFLNPSLDEIHSWELLHDARRAAEVILQAVDDQEKIFIHGDFDCDGVSATSILWDFMYRQLGADVLPYIPSRFDEGYGLSEASITAMLKQGAQLIITVDCGVKDTALVEKYTEQGVKFIITDHHTLPSRESEGEQQSDTESEQESEDYVSESALAVVHPRHPQGSYPFPEISGTTVAWKLAWALNDIAGKGYDMYKYLDLVALATVCDVMPLTDENRPIVKFGLERLKDTENIGLQALMQIASVDPGRLETYHFGFVIGPRINAAGRVGSAVDAVRLLTTESYVAAKGYAQQLEELNGQRQQMTRELMQEAEAQLAESEEAALHFIYGDGWHEGIVGLAAGKLTEKYNRPVLVGSRNGDEIKASARSISGFHISNALREHAHLLERFGGHELAAGFTVKVGNADEFALSITSLASEQLTADDLEKQLKIDAVLESNEVSAELVDEVGKMAPFGMGNPSPVVVLEELTISDVRTFGRDNQHIRFYVEEIDNFELISFNGAEDYLHVQPGSTVKAAGKLGLNEWNGSVKVQLRVADLKSES